MLYRAHSNWAAVWLVMYAQVAKKHDNICTNASKNGAAGGDVCVANHEAYLSDTLVFNYQIMGANTVHTRIWPYRSEPGLWPPYNVT